MSAPCAASVTTIADGCRQPYARLPPACLPVAQSPLPRQQSSAGYVHRRARPCGAYRTRRPAPQPRGQPGIPAAALQALAGHDPQPELFALYGNTLGGLACNPSTEADLRRFEFGLLDALGYGFDPAHDGHSGLPVEPGRWYQYQAEFGLVACSDAVAAQGTRFAGADLLGIAAGQYDGEYSMAAKRLLRQALASHLGERPLHSRELFRQFRHAGRQQ